MAKYGHSMEEIYERLPSEPLELPGFEDLRYPHGGGADGDSSDVSSDNGSDGGDRSRRPKAGDDIIEEFRRERLRDEEQRL